MGENAKFIVTGDATQIDLPNREGFRPDQGHFSLEIHKGHKRNQLYER